MQTMNCAPYGIVVNIRQIFIIRSLDILCMFCRYFHLNKFIVIF